MASSTLPLGSKEEIFAFTVQVLKQCIEDLDHGNLVLYAPRTLGLMRATPGMPFHLTAELFTQISGITSFEFPEEKIDLYPGQMCLVPPGMPHRERVRSHQNKPFLNLVFGYSGDFFHFHVAHEVKKGVPTALPPQYLNALDIEFLRNHLKTVLQWFHKKDAKRELAVKSALLNHLFAILSLMESPVFAGETYKGILIQRMLAQYLSNPELSVEWIARNMQASPDYVSRLFRKTTGKCLTAHITEQRLLMAKHLLEASPSNISEISQAVGYENPGYFSQLFRRIHGLAPRDYREKYSRRQWGLTAGG